METVKKLTFKERIKNAVNAFYGRKIGAMSFGIDLKRCDQCEYKNRAIGYRDNLLVIAGARAAYMDSKDVIDIPEGTDGEDEYSYFIKDLVDYYDAQLVDVNFDEYIENALITRYGKENPDETQRI